MKISWFRPEHSRDPKKKKDFELALRNSRVITDRFLELLETMSNAVESLETNYDTYSAGWEYRQAYLNGRKAQIKEMRELFNFINDHVESNLTTN